MSRSNLKYYQCPNCKSTGTFEEVYCGGHPHIYQYACTECGISSPVSSSEDKEMAKRLAYHQLGKFLINMNEPIKLLQRLYMSIDGVEFSIEQGSAWMDFVSTCEQVRDYLEDNNE